MYPIQSPNQPAGAGGYVPYFYQAGVFQRYGLAAASTSRSEPGDTVTAGSISALKCGYDFFGADRLLFGTDAPMDSQAGIRQTEVSIRTIEQLDISEEEKHKIFVSNAVNLFRLPLSPVE